MWTRETPSYSGSSSTPRAPTSSRATRSTGRIGRSTRTRTCGEPSSWTPEGTSDSDLRRPGLVGTNQASLGRASCDVLGGEFGNRTFVMKAITLHKRTRVAISRNVEKPSSRENADADPMPPMNAIGATYARNSPARGPLAQAGHITANPRSGAGSALVARRLLVTTWNARANTSPERSDNAIAAATEYG